MAHESSTTAPIPERVFHPFTLAFRASVQLQLAAFALLLPLLGVVLGDPSLYAMGFFPFLAMPLAEALIRIARAKRRSVYVHGAEVNATIVRKYTTWRGPMHGFTVRYDFLGQSFEASSLVPFDVWIHCAVGKSLPIRVEPSRPRVWVLSRAAAA